jgi:hypothetical protein
MTGTRNVRVPTDLLKMVVDDLPEGHKDDTPGPILLKAYEEYRQLHGLAEYLRAEGFKDGRTDGELVRNYVAYATSQVIDTKDALKDQIIKLQDEVEWYRVHFVGLWEMFLKGDVLGVRTSLPYIVNRVKEEETKEEDSWKVPNHG